MVVTKHKDDEFSSSSNYAMFDGADPVVDFSNFYKDNDTIVDEVTTQWQLYNFNSCTASVLKEPIAIETETLRLVVVKELIFVWIVILLHLNIETVVVEV